VTDYNAGDIELAIHRALEVRDLKAVVALLHMLAVADPRRAQAVLDIVELAGVIDRA
jgi:hypothetical protein